VNKTLKLIKKYKIPAILVMLAVSSRLVGFVRNAFIAYYFGTTRTADVLQILLFPTDFVTAYLMNQTIITSLTIYFSRQSEKRNNIFTNIFHFYTIFLLFASILLAIVMLIMNPEIPWYYSVVSVLPGVFYGMAGIIQGYLNYNKKFLWSGAQELIAHLVLLSGVLVAFRLGVVWYVGIMILTGLVRVLVQLPDLRKTIGTKSWFKELFYTEKIFFEWNLLVYIGPLIFTFVLSGIPSFYVLRLLNNTGEGYVSAYNYSMKIIGLFNSIIVVPLTTYLIPTLERKIKEKKSIASINTFALATIGGLGVIAALIASIFPEWINTLIYARGDFNAESIWLTSEFLRYHAFAMVGYALMYYLLQITMLRNKPMQLMVSFIVGTVLIMALLIFLPFATYITVGVSFTIGVMGSVIILLF